MSGPDAAVSSLLENLNQILACDYPLDAPGRESIEDLRTELLSIQSLMLDFCKNDMDSLIIEQTAKEIGNLLREAEDLVDTGVLHAAAPASRRWISRAFSPVKDYPFRLRNILKEINAKVDELKLIKPGFESDPTVAEHHRLGGKSNESDQAPRQVDENQVYGFDYAIESIQELLVCGAECLEVVSIVGMAGLGKTTLAKKAFVDPDVDYEYKMRAFLHVSQEYDKREVLLQLLTSISVTNEQVHNMSEDQLGKQVYRELEGKQYLIVLDDVWERRDWDQLKSVFPNNDKRCRVLLTTRNEEVANLAKFDNYFNMDFLPLEDSRKLLRWRVFQQDEMDESHSDLVSYEIEIAKICDGLPFVVVVIAGILLNHPHSVSWWKDVANNLKDYTARDPTQTCVVMSFMYKHLPNYLKPCFLYFGVFSEHSEILVWKLVRLWISEGFIPQRGDIKLEDLAEQYLEELVHRNLVIVDQVRRNGRMKKCHVHNILREFCKTEGARDNIFQEIKKDMMIDNLTLDQCRRLSSNNANILDYISRAPRGKCVHSFLTFVREETSVEPELVSCVPKTFRLLKVLEMQSLIFNRFPADMCSLVLLKYVALSSTFSILPAAMSSLSNFQTLLVMTTSDTLDIKADLWKMPHFRHLHTNASATLPTSSPKLHRFKALEILKLLNGDTGSKLNSLPKEFPPWLKKLTLMNTRREWSEMSTLGNLESLEVLKLKEYAFQGSFWNMKEVVFGSLRHLYVGPTDLVVWGDNTDHFPKLESLELNGCSKLETLPYYLGGVQSLQTMVIHCVSPMVASMARRIQVRKLEQAKTNCRNMNFSLTLYPPGH